MAINIKNEKVCALAREAAELTHTTQTSAIELALERLLFELRARDEAAERSRQVDEILADFDCRLSPEHRAAMSTDVLYDERGLPR